MAATTPADENGVAQPTSSKKYTRFPRSAISAGLDFPKAIIKEGYDLKKDRLCGLLNRSATSGATDAALAAVRAYGLLEDREGGYIGVSELGRRACSEDPSVRTNAFAEALSKVDEFRRFLDRYAESKVPSEGVAEDHLTSQMGLRPQEAKVFYKIVIENARDAGLTETLPGGEFFRSNPAPPATPAGPDEESSGDDPLAPLAPAAVPPTPLVPQAPPSSRTVEMHFNVQVHLPESTDPEVYDAIFRSMKSNLIGD